MKIKLEKVGLPGRKYRRPRATKVAAYDEVINKMGVGESFSINTYPDSINVRNCINYWKKEGNTAIYTVRKTEGEYRCWRLA
jgi:predicted double-glycine peptidase